MLLAGSLAAQEAAAPAGDLAWLRAALGAPVPELRAEAALALASCRLPEDYPRLVPLTHDPDPQARAAGILALGVLGAPGAATLLADLFDEGRRGSPERVVAAYAIGLLPDPTMPPRLTDYLSRLNGANLRREEEILRALFSAGTVRPRPAMRTAMRDLLFDQANKAEELKVQLLHALSQVPMGLDPEEADELLSEQGAKLRCATLDYLRLAIDGARIPLTDERRDRIVRLAERDPNAAVRARALALLTTRRVPAALELGARALRSHEPEELAAGVTAMVVLGGGSLRAALERRILDENRQGSLAVLFAHLPATDDPELLDAGLELALDVRMEFAVRCQAAVLLARSGDTRIGAELRSLFTAATRAGDVATIAAGLRHTGMDFDLAERCHPPTGADELRRLPARVQGLALAGYDVRALVHSVCGDASLPDQVKAQVLRAARVGGGRLLGPHVPIHLEMQSLPEPVAALLDIGS